MKRMPYWQFEANGMLFRIGTLAYKLFRLFTLRVLSPIAVELVPDRAVTIVLDRRQDCLACRPGVSEGQARPLSLFC
jgi:hypothetical protein